MTFRIRSWGVSYYLNDERRWVNGTLICSPESISFEVNSECLGATPEGRGGEDSRAPGAALTVRHWEVSAVRLARSMLVYPAVTVATSAGALHWFSSLPDQSVFNTLGHFARHALLHAPPAPAAVKPPVVSTRLGARLLRSADQSERTLAAAAQELHGQGRQLDRAGLDLHDIHDDLDVGDRVLAGLTAYLGHWRLPEKYLAQEPVFIGADDLVPDQDLEVLSSELSQDRWHSQQLSILRVTQDALTLLSERQRPLHSFRWMELSRVFIVSPWEVVLTKHVAGRAPVSVSVVSASLGPVLQVLQRRVSHLVDFQALPTHLRETHCADEDTRTGSSKTQTASTGPHSQLTALGGSGRKAAQRGTAASGAITQLTLQKGDQQEEEVVSEAELLALHSKLGGLKMMATAVGEELTNQNVALDNMIASVDHADSRVRDQTQRTKRLM